MCSNRRCCPLPHMKQILNWVADAVTKHFLTLLFNIKTSLWMKGPPGSWVCAQTWMWIHCVPVRVCPCLRTCACMWSWPFFGDMKCVCVCMCAYKSVIPQPLNQMSPKPRCHSSRWQPNESWGALLIVFTMAQAVTWRLTSLRLSYI